MATISIPYELVKKLSGVKGFEKASVQFPWACVKAEI